MQHNQPYRFRHSAAQWLFGSVVLALLTFVCFRLHVNPTTVALLYLIVIVAKPHTLSPDIKEAAGVFRFGLLDRWRLLILSGIFPYLVTGMVTAAGDAWNASIVAEYLSYKGTVLTTPGLGSLISVAASSANFPLLAASLTIMVALVTVFNRTVWARIYHVSQTRFRMDL